jgi:hypothetical protein
MCDADYGAGRNFMPRMRPRPGELDEHGDAARAVAHQGLRHGAEGAGGQLRRRAQAGRDRLDAAVHATEAVVVAVMPGRVRLEQVGEGGDVAVRERLEET